MIYIQLRQGMVTGSRPAYCYRLAGEELVADIPIPYLSIFERKCSEVPIRCEKSAAKYPILEYKQLYQGQGWVGNQWREVSCHSSQAGYEIAVADIGEFMVRADGKAIRCLKREKGADWELILDAVLGPALILALALHGKFCLHASAVSMGGKNVAFVGESGKGKSTLARWLAGQDRAERRRIGDDILPVSQSAGGVQFLPHFPQLKIPAAEQPSAGLPEQLPVQCIYFIRRPQDEESVAIRSMSSRDATLSLVRHTVSSRLFDEDLLAKHLDFCVLVSDQVPVKELTYPLQFEALTAVKESLQRDLGLSCLT